MANLLEDAQRRLAKFQKLVRSSPALIRAGQQFGKRKQNIAQLPAAAESFSIGAGQAAARFPVQVANTFAKIGNAVPGPGKRVTLDKNVLSKRIFPEKHRVLKEDPFAAGAGRFAFETGLLQGGAAHINKLGTLKPLQTSLGHSAGKFFSGNTGQKLIGRGIAGASQGLPFTISSALINAAQNNDIGAGFALDLAIDSLIGPSLARATKNISEGLELDLRKKIVKAIKESDKAQLEEAIKLAKANGVAFDSNTIKQLKLIVSQKGSVGGLSSKSLAGLQGADLEKALVNKRAFSNVKDKGLRFFISDKQANLKRGNLKEATKRGFSTLDEIYTHPQFFKEYPQARNLTVNFDPSIKARGSYDEAAGRINLHPDNINEKTLGVLLHENQHFIQGVEGFTRGGSLKELGEKGYLENIGEADARATATFRNLNQSEGRGRDLLAEQTATEGIRAGDLKTKDAGGVSFSEEGITSIKKTSKEKFVEGIKEGKFARAKQEAMATEERAARFIRAKQAGFKAGGGEAGAVAEKQALKGALPKQQFEKVTGMTPEDVDWVYREVDSSTEFDFLEKLGIKEGAARIFGTSSSKDAPTESMIRGLETVFGKDVVDAMQTSKTFYEKFTDAAGQVLGIPRSMKAGFFDMSFGLRQGLVAGWRHPGLWAKGFKDQFKWFFSDAQLKALNTRIETHPDFQLHKQAGIEYTGVGEDLLKREEEFASSLAEKIPGIGKFIRASGRAYTGYANQLRFDIMNHQIRQARLTGDIKNPGWDKSMALLVNTMTGRGDLGSLEKLAGPLSTVLFSPRNFKARVDFFSPASPIFYAKLEPSVRKEYLKSLFAYLGGTASLLGLAALNSDIDVNTDPNNSDYLKIKPKGSNTRIDVMGGFQQQLVALSRVITGKMTSSTSGREIELGEGYKPTTRADIVGRFFTNKFSPIVSFLHSMAKQQTPTGEDFKLNKEAVNLVTPIFIEDMVDLYMNGDIDLWPTAGPTAFFGGGVQTYGKQVTKIEQNKLGENVLTIGAPKGLADFATGADTTGTANKVTGGALNWYKHMKTLSPQEGNEMFKRIKQANPGLAARIKKEKVYEDLQLTPTQINFASQGVADGSRAVSIMEELNKIDSPVEKNALVKKLRDAKIITDEVLEQLKGMI